MHRASAEGWPRSARNGAAALARLAWTLFVGAALLVSAAWLGPSLVRASAPAWAAVIETMAPDFRVTRIDVAAAGGDNVVEVEVTLARTVYLGGRVQRADPSGRAQARVPWGQVGQGPLAALLLALAWPARTVRALYLRMALLMPWLVMLWLVDVPVTLAATLWGLVLGAMAPGDFSALVAAGAFLNAGGRVAVAVTVAVLAIRASERAAGHR